MISIDDIIIIATIVVAIVEISNQLLKIFVEDENYNSLPKLLSYGYHHICKPKNILDYDRIELISILV